MSDPFRIRRVTAPDIALAEALTDVLLDVVEAGASVGFMAPLARGHALAYWQDALPRVARGERILLVAEELPSGAVIGTVQLAVAMPDNQPHRGDVLKMQVRRSAQRRGVGAALLRAIESAACEAGKTLLVLDTVTGSAGERLYARLGWERCGVIPDYALFPDGRLCDTTVFYRRLGDASKARSA